MVPFPPCSRLGEHSAGVQVEARGGATQTLPDQDGFQLPEQDGFAVVAQLRRDARLSRVPLAVYSARDLNEADRQRLRLGETVFFTKGRVNPDEFERHVVDLLGQLTQNTKEVNHG
jgi:CheY-like chemotaxis protein